MKKIISTLPLILLPLFGHAGQTVRPAPQLTGDASHWLQSAPKTSLGGKVTVVEFWTLGCINCKHNLPIYNRWYNKYAGKGLQIIGVHTPETTYERNLSHVKESIKHWDIKYPVVFDENETNWNRWGVSAWPAVYLVDKHGKIRYSYDGELNYNGRGGEAEFNGYIEKLLAEK